MWDAGQHCWVCNFVSVKMQDRKHCSVVFGRKGAKKNAAERKSDTEKKSDGGAKQSVAGVDGQKEPAKKSASTDAADKTKPASKPAVPSAGGKSSEKKSADLDDWLKEWSKDKKP